MTKPKHAFCEGGCAQILSFAYMKVQCIKWCDNLCGTCLLVQNMYFFMMQCFHSEKNAPLKSWVFLIVFIVKPQQVLI